MKTAFIFVLVLSSCIFTALAGKCPIYPTKITDKQESLSQNTVIVISDKAGDAEKYAAVQLHKIIEKYFKLTFPIVNQADFNNEGAAY